MDTVTLDHEQYLNFTGWSGSTYAKKGQAERIDKLCKMGVRVDSVSGKGKKAEYTIIIPSAFWKLLIIQKVSFSEVGANYLDILIEGKGVIKTLQDSIIKFDSEIHDELASKYSKDLESVKTTCKRIKAFLNEYDYINGNLAARRKSHRVKKPFLLTKEWVTDAEALRYDHLARGHWRTFFKKKLSMYQEIESTATSLPSSIFSGEITKLYSFGMSELLGVSYYRVAKETVVEENLLSDIQFVRTAFLESRNLIEVLNELTVKQEQYKMNKKLRIEKAKAATRNETEKQKLSKEKRVAIKKQLHLIELERESSNPPTTKEQIEQIEKAVRSIFQ